MNALAQEFKKYLDRILGFRITIKGYARKDIFPLFLHGLYDFYQAKIFNKEHLLAVAKSKERPSAICKHVWLAEQKAGIPCIYINSPANFSNYRQLIAHRIFFVIPGKQIYLPQIGIDWVENCRSCRLSHKFQESHKSLSPLTQVVLIHALTHRNYENFSLRQFAQELSYTPMSISRSLDELEGRKLGHTVRKNKERFFHFAFTSRALWESSYLLLKSPVKKRIWIQCKNRPPGFLAGMSALAKLTHITEPEHPVYAIGYKQCQPLSFKLCEGPDDADIELEIWRYDPGLFAVSGHVDPFSLYLSLRELQDERVEEALETMITDILC